MSEGGIHHSDGYTQYNYGVVRAETGRVIASYRPTSVGERAGEFARLMAKTASPESPERAKAFLFACSKLAAFALSVGLDLSPEVCLSASVIERFVLSGTQQMTLGTRRTLRTNLRHVAAKVLEVSPTPCKLGRSKAKDPYTRTEISSYLALSDAQPTASRRRRSCGLICLGAGAGLMGDELRHVRGRDVTARSGGVVVVVAGRHPRVVPVLASYHDRLLSTAEAAGEGLVLGGSSPDPNVVSRLTASLAGGVGLPRIETGRLRATWLATAAELTGLKAFMDAAGVRHSGRIGELVGCLTSPSEEEAVALLGARS